MDFFGSLQAYLELQQGTFLGGVRCCLGFVGGSMVCRGGGDFNTIRFRIE